MINSLISNEKVCFVCGNPNVVLHHVYEGHANRPKSDTYGCVVWLCPRHHNMSNEGVHMNHELDLQLKRLCQGLWQEHYKATTEEFRTIFGKSYI